MVESFFTPTFIWSLLGIFMLLLEVFGAAGFGFLFAGLAALTVSAMVGFHVIVAGDYVAQILWWLGLTLGWLALLWYPIYKIRGRKSADNQYDNIVGTTAIVASAPLVAGKVGRVKWSGTIMKAKLAEDQTQEVHVGKEVSVVGMQSNVLIVKKIEH